MRSLLPYLHQVSDGKVLSRQQAAETMDVLIDEPYPPEQAAMLLGALRARGETVEELVGFATALRRRSVSPPVRREGLVDTCGTGGDCAGTFNISTAAGLVAAAAGAGVAKHGNRAASSRCGSADVLEALGLRIDPPPEQTAAAIDSVGFGFLFAPMYHPVLRRLAPLRRAVGVRTVFNLLGPLLNPAPVQRQLIGISDVRMARPLAAALRELGVLEARVVAGADGMDELTLTGATHVVHLHAGCLNEMLIYPEDAGLVRCPSEALRGGGASDNARLIESLLCGELHGPQRDVVTLNAAALLQLAGCASGLRDGTFLVGEALDGGHARQLLSRLREIHV